MIKDYLGNEVNVGDKIVYVTVVGSSPDMHVATVTEFLELSEEETGRYGGSYVKYNYPYGYKIRVEADQSTWSDYEKKYKRGTSVLTKAPLFKVPV